MRSKQKFNIHICTKHQVQNEKKLFKENSFQQISEADPLPHLVCQSCWSTTEAFHELYQKSKIVQDQFLHHEHKFGADINEESPDEIDEQPILEEPHFIGTFKEEPGNLKSVK